MSLSHKKNRDFSRTQKPKTMSIALRDYASAEYPLTIKDVSCGLVAGGVSGLFIRSTGIHLSSLFKQTRLQRSVANELTAVRQGMRSAPLLGLYLSIVAPISEEIAFRSLWQRRVMPDFQSEPDSLQSRATRVIAVSGAFSLCHLEYRQGVRFNTTILLWTFIAGSLYGGLAEWSNNLWAPTVAHITVNSLSTLSVWRCVRTVRPP